VSGVRAYPAGMTRETLDEDGVPLGAPVVPVRITVALDARDLYGPKVDRDCGTWEGNPAGDVDAWELGEAVPSREQVRLLAALCEVPVALFYEPLTEDERVGVVYICGRSGPKGGGRRVCHRIVGPPRPPAAADPPTRQGTLF
jgi:hypothetical protein